MGGARFLTDRKLGPTAELHGGRFFPENKNDHKNWMKCAASIGMLSFYTNTKQQQQQKPTTATLE